MVKAYRPANLKEALEIAESMHCIIFAGGTDLMIKYRNQAGVGFGKPLLFISDLKELKDIKSDGGILTIGAACTCSKIGSSDIVPDYIKSVFNQMASPGIRNMATIGGNICNSSPAGDSLPLLYALNALLVLESSSGKREMPIEQFVTGPGKTNIKQGEILTEIKIPLKEFQVKICRKVGTRKSTALSKLSFIGLSEIKDSTVEDIRIAFGAVGPTVVRSREAEQEIIKIYLKGKPDAERIRQIYGDLIKPIDDQRSTAFYRKEAALRLLEDFLTNKVSL